MQRVFLVEIGAYDPVGAALVTLRFTSGLGYNHPSAPGFYEPRLVEPGQISRSMFGSGTTTGPAELGFGEIRLANIDGGLDQFRDYGFDGRVVRVLAGDEAGDYGSFATVFTGTTGKVQLTESYLQIVLRDRLAELDKPLLTETYGGTNVAPDGVDGDDDIKGQLIPRAYKIVRGAPVKWVNKQKDIYQISDRPVQSISAVYDNLVQLPRHTPDYADQAEMEDDDELPPAGYYRAWSAGGMFRLGAPAVGLVAADAEESSTPADNTTAQTLKQIALDAGVASGDISSADVTALDAANSAEVGEWVSDADTPRSLMSAIAQSIGAWFGFDRFGMLRMGRLQAPSGTPVATIKKLALGEVAGADTLDLLDGLAIVSGNDGDDGLPIYRCIVEFARCYAVQPAAADSSIDPDVRSRFAAEFRRTAPAEDLSVQTVHPLAPELIVTTRLHGGSGAADAEAARVLALRKVRRDRITAPVRADDFALSVLDLGAVVKLQIPRFGMSGGKLFVVTGMTYRLAQNRIDLDLWG